MAYPDINPFLGALVGQQGFPPPPASPEDDFIGVPPQTEMVPEAMRGVLADAIRRIPAGQPLPRSTEPGTGAYRVEQPGVPVPEGVAAAPWSGPEIDPTSGKAYGGAPTHPRAEVLREILAQNRRYELLQQLDELVSRGQAEPMAALKMKQGLLAEMEKPTATEAQTLGGGTGSVTPVGDVGSVVQYYDPQQRKWVTRFVEGAKGGESGTMQRALQQARQELGPNASIGAVTQRANEIAAQGLAGLRGTVAGATGFQGRTGRGLAELQPDPRGTSGLTLSGAEAAAKAAGAPIPSGERADLASMQNFVGVVTALHGRWPEAAQYFGPVRGRAGTIGEMMPEGSRFGVTPEEADVRATVKDLENRITYLLSGKQINESEAQRLKATMPTIDLQPHVAKARLDRFVSVLADILRERQRLQTAPAATVGDRAAPSAGGLPPGVTVRRIR